MPSLGADMEAGTLVRWLVKPGDSVRRGDIVAEVETDKATVQVEIWETGRIEALLVPEGEEVPVGTTLATLAAVAAVPSAKAAPPGPATKPPAPLPERRVTPTATRLAAELHIDLEGVAGSGVGGAVTRADVQQLAKTPPSARQPRVSRSGAPRVPASPAARREAARRGITLESFHGSGPGGAVVLADLAGTPAAATPQPPPAPVAQARARRSLAAAMERSHREIPHYYLATHIDLSAALKWLEAQNAVLPVANRILSSAMLLKAVALAARTTPAMNGWYSDSAFRAADHVHLGVAISLRGGGLVAPAIHDADTLSLGELMAALRDLVNRARAGILRSSEIADPTITVTSLGEQGVETVFPIIFPPQVAIVGFGRIREQPWAENGMLGIRPAVQASLAADHRVSDGHLGGLFLDAISNLLREPEKL